MLQITIILFKLKPSINFATEFKSNIFNKIISQNSTKEEIFYQLFKYAFIPLFLNTLGKDTLQNFKKLLPDKNNTILDKFIELIKNDIDFSVSLDKLEANKLAISLDKPEIIENFRKATSRAKEDRDRQMPITFEYMLKRFPNSPTVLQYFLYAKSINFMFKSFGKEKGCQLVSYIEDLIDNPETEVNKQILSLNVHLTLETINLNLKKNPSDKLENFLIKISKLEKENKIETLKNVYLELIDFGLKKEMIGSHLQETQFKYKDISNKFNEINKVKLEECAKPIFFSKIQEFSEHKKIIEKEFEIIISTFKKNTTFTLQDVIYIYRNITDILEKYNVDIDIEDLLINQESDNIYYFANRVFDNFQEPSLENIISTLIKITYPKTTDKYKKIVLGSL